MELTQRFAEGGAQRHVGTEAGHATRLGALRFGAQDPARLKASVGPPRQSSLVTLPRDEPPILLVVIDTEEEFDWSKPFDRTHVGVGHMRDIEKLQRVFDEFSIRPLYAVDFPIATQRESATPLRAIVESGRAEIGAHLHPWVTPPFDEEVNARNSYPGNLPRELERAKLTRLVQAIEANLGVLPRAYKAGRYGFGPNTAAILEELGFEIDLSHCPAFDFRADGGPDYSAFRSDPFWIGTHRRVLTVPATGAFVGLASRSARTLYPLALRPACRRVHVAGVLAWTGMLERLHLSPEGYDPIHHRRLTRHLLAEGLRVFTFSLHSPSIRPGHTPYVRSQADLTRFLDACRRYFEFFLRELGGTSMTPLALKRTLEKEALEVRA